MSPLPVDRHRLSCLGEEPGFSMVMIQGTTKLLGVMGWPIAHSMSPAMHNAALAKLQADYVYLPLPVPPDQLQTALAGLAAIGMRGFSVTIPHKQAIMPYLTEISDLAQAIGAVNTVWRTAAGWSGTNTDVYGFVSPLKALDRDWSQTRALVLGNGGAARAVVAGCAQLGMANVQVVGRDSEKLAAFQASWADSPIAVSLQSHLWSTLPDLLPTADLIVNTTPIGMSPHIHASPLDTAALDQIQPGTIVYDLIYSPSPTQLLQQASQRGAIAIDGMEMLVQQGAAAFQIWLEQPAPVEVMRQALKQKLAEKG